MKLHQWLTPPSFAIASFVGSTNGLAFEHQREVSSVSGEVKPLSVPLQGGLRFLPFPLPTSPLSTLRFPTSYEERYGLTLFRCKDITDSLGFHFTPAALLAHDGGVQSLRAHCKERRASSAPRRLRRLDEFAYANHAIPPWPRSASMLADTPLPHGFSANLTVAGFVVRAFHNKSLPSRYGS